MIVEMPLFIGLLPSPSLKVFFFEQELWLDYWPQGRLADTRGTCALQGHVLKRVMGFVFPHMYSQRFFRFAFQDDFPWFLVHIDNIF